MTARRLLCKRSRIARLLAATSLILLAGVLPGVARASTVVSFTFDDGRATAYNAGPILASHGMKGTFYINSNTVGSDSYYMTWSQLGDLAAAGHEIGGHTLDHVVLTSVSAAEAQRQVCDDRTALQAHGFTVNSFAYPEIAYNASVEQIVRDCGYHSARAGDATFPPAETLPPADPFALRTVQAADANQTLQQMEDMVTNVEQSGGGWVIFLMHSVCSGCPDQLNTTPQDLDALASWLQPRAANGTVVRTVGDVIDGPDTTAPTSTIACNGNPCSTSAYTSTPVTVSLSGTDDRTPASGVSIKYTTDGSDPAVNGLPYTSAFPITATSTIRWYAQDAAGNREASRSTTITVNAQQALPRTTVSLTFDDGTSSEYWARDQLKSRGMHGTFYINSSRVGTSGYYMTWNQIQDLYSDGNEIGGHTAHHVNLPAIEPDEAKREICTDRSNLLARGFPATNLAYPYGAHDAATEQMVADCGYNSARTTQPGLETIPPASPYAIKVGPGGNDLQGMKDAVTAAENAGGGWVPIVFHQICNACDTNWITQSDFEAFLDWLKPREANGTAVRTMQQVLGGSVKPAVAGPAPRPAPNGWNGLKNASLEYDTDGDKAPDCWAFDGYGSNQPTWSRTNDAHTGSWAERVDVSNYVDGDNKLAVGQDLGSCTPSVTPGHRYTLTAWYKSSNPVFFTAFTRDSTGMFDFWNSSPSIATAATWTKATWTTPVIPAGVTGLSFGLTLAGNGFLVMDDLGIDDAAPTGGPDTTAPTVSVTTPAAGSIVAGTIAPSATASDNIAVDHVDFLVDGTLSDTRVSAPYTTSVDTRRLMNGDHTIVARAVDTSGNTTSSSARTFTVNNSDTELLKNTSFETASGGVPTCWLRGGYGTNSFTWTRTSDAHTGSFADNLNVTSYTNGDRKLVSQQDSGACAPAAIPGHSYSFNGWYKLSPLSGLVQPIVFAYYRNAAGAWIYWTQSKVANATTWTKAAWATPAVPAGATAISIGMGLTTTGSLTMDDFALFDNSPPPDTTPPASSINCHDVTSGSAEAENDSCISGYYPGAVQVSLSATDNVGGSGVASIRYTTNGTDPTTSNGSVYSGPFTVNSTTTVKYRAYDNAGNAGAVSSQLIQVDPAPPQSAITCNAAACQSDFYGAGVSVRLSATDTGGSGVSNIYYTTDGSDPSLSNGRIYLGRFSVTSSSTVKYRAYDNAGNAEAVNSQLVKVDTTAPSSAIHCGALTDACSPSPYFGSVDVYLSGTDADAGIDSIRYTTDGTDPTTTNGTVYAGPFTLTSTATVRYRAFDRAGNAEPVNAQTINVGTAGVTLTSPADGSTVSGSTDVSATASGISVDHVDFVVDGSVVGSDTTAPYSVPWDTTASPDGAHTVMARVFDGSGTETDSGTVTVTVTNAAPDTTPPTSDIQCDGATCRAGAYAAAVSVTLSATDGNGSGVDHIQYTTDNSDPSATNGTRYGGAFSVAGTTTIKYRAYDHAGNVEAVQSKQIQIDTVAPTSSIFCNNGPCGNTYSNSGISVSLAASDSGGSGVDSIRYTTDGSDPSATNGSTFTAPFTVTSTTSVRYRAYDGAGNVEPINLAVIRVDTTPPSSTIKCNGGSCAGAFQPGASISLSATDADSGVASIRYTTNGTDPTATTGTVYSASFAVNATTTVKYRAFDKTGNAEAVNTQVVQIDTTAPTATLTAPTAGTAVGGSATLSANASDNVGLDRVEFQVDGTTVATDSSAPYSVTWDSQTVADGPHTFRARAVDTAGNAATSAAVSASTTNGTNLLQNPSLETATGSTPTCWLLSGYGTNTYAWTRTSDAHLGSFATKLDVTAWTNGDRKLVSAQDTGACAPNAIVGRSYTVTDWYKSTVAPVLYAYYRNTAGAWVYWAQSSQPASASWAQAVWTTPAVPSGATALSIGMGLPGVGSVTMDQFGLLLNG